jgi:hypothetical protein
VNTRLKRALLATVAVGVLTVPAGAQAALPQPALSVVQPAVQAKVDVRATRDTPAGFEQSRRTIDLWQVGGLLDRTLRLCARVTYNNPITADSVVTAENLFTDFVTFRWYRVNTRYVGDFSHLLIRVKKPASCDGGHPPGEWGDGDI